MHQNHPSDLRAGKIKNKCLNIPELSKSMIFLFLFFFSILTIKQHQKAHEDFYNQHHSGHVLKENDKASIFSTSGSLKL